MWKNKRITEFILSPGVSICAGLIDEPAFSSISDLTHSIPEQLIYHPLSQHHWSKNLYYSTTDLALIYFSVCYGTFCEHTYSLGGHICAWHHDCCCCCCCCCSCLERCDLTGDDAVWIVMTSLLCLVVRPSDRSYEFRRQVSDTSSV